MNSNKMMNISFYLCIIILKNENEYMIIDYLVGIKNISNV